MRSWDKSMSLNMPSSLFVKFDPHSLLSLPIMDFSRSTDELFPSSNLLARSFL